MDATAAAASVAAISGLAAYVNGKYHIGQDLRALRFKKRAAGYYEELVHDRAVQWGNFFLSQGVKPGDMVATYMMNSADFMVIWLGLFCIGCAPAHLNYNLKGEGLVHCLKVAGVKIVLVDEEEGCMERFEGVRATVEEMGVTAFKVDEELTSKVYQGSTQVPGDEYRENVVGTDPTCLLYTSGTTGLPKAGKFMVNRYHERGNPQNLTFDQKAGPDGDRWYCCMPLFHGTGGLAVMGALTAGMSVAIGRKFSVSTFWDDIHDSRSTVFVYVGEAARYLLMAPPHPRERDHRLRAMYGNGMRPDVWNRFKERFNVPEVIEFFNSTEGVLAMVVHSKGPFTATTVAQHGAIIRRALNNIYVPVPIDPETGELLRDPKTGFVKRNSYNEGGEILVAVPNEQAFAGYHNNPKATAKKFERDVFQKGDLYYRSGDALRRDDDGRWYFLDRLGDTFRWKSETCQRPSPDTFDWKALLDYSRSKLPRYAVPLFLRLVKEASNTDNQKQNKAPLREEGMEIDKFGTKVVGGGNDVVMWMKPGENRYVRFTMADLEALRAGKTLL
ncbi:unnamed protein product [Alternaria alternata]